MNTDVLPELQPEGENQASSRHVALSSAERYRLATELVRRAERQLPLEDHATPADLQLARDTYLRVLQLADPSTPAQPCPDGVATERGAPPPSAADRRALLQLRLRAIVALERLSTSLSSAPSPRDARRRQLLTVCSLAGFAALAFVAALWAADRFDLGNIARGARWEASSTYSPQQPRQGTLDAGHPGFFFHTDLEDHPWLRIDLGAPRLVSSVIVINRDDCCRARAVPLVLEGSSDGVSFHTIAQRREVFDVWRTYFLPQKMRYLRLRVTRRSYFHLRHVIVRA